MEIETRDFEFAHGKRPGGRGSWAFVFLGVSHPELNRVVTEFAPSDLLYSEAKKWARGRAKVLKAHTVKVAS